MYFRLDLMLVNLMVVLRVLSKPVKFRGTKVNDTERYSSHACRVSSRNASQLYHGEATTWNANWASGNCVFQNWAQPKGLGPIAIASNLWDSAGACGACITITGPFGTHQGIVSDQCASCKPNSLDLGPSLWALVSNHQNPGVVPISWKKVPCNFSTPIEFINKDGVSKDWNSVQVAGSNLPIKSLDVLPISNGSSGEGNNKKWIKLTKQSNSNYFQPESGKALGSSADLRVTCENGKQFITKNVNLDRAGNSTAATANC